MSCKPGNTAAVHSMKFLPQAEVASLQATCPSLWFALQRRDASLQACCT